MMTHEMASANKIDSLGLCLRLRAFQMPALTLAWNLIPKRARAICYDGRGGVSAAGLPLGYSLRVTPAGRL